MWARWSFQRREHSFQECEERVEDKAQAWPSCPLGFWPSFAGFVVAFNRRPATWYLVFNRETERAPLKSLRLCLLHHIQPCDVFGEPWTDCQTSFKKVRKMESLLSPSWIWSGDRECETRTFGNDDNQMKPTNKQPTAKAWHVDRSPAPEKTLQDDLLWLPTAE